MPIFSIIIPVYNVENYIQQCIHSIQAQSFSDWEAIIVDDCSPDTSISIVLNMIGDDSRFKIIRHSQNKGLVTARDTGVSNSSGKYVIFVDSDDWIETEMLSILNLKLIQHDYPDIVLFGMSKYIKGKETNVPLNVLSGYYAGESLVATIQKNMLSFSPKTKERTVSSNVYTKIYRREIIEQLNGKIQADITMGEDIPRSYPAILMAKTLLVLDNSFYHYRQNVGSMSLKYFPKYLSQMLWVYPFINSIAEEQQIDIRDSIQENIAHSAASAVYDVMLSKKTRREIMEFIKTDICGNPDIIQACHDAKGFHDYLYLRMMVSVIRRKKIHLAYYLAYPMKLVHFIQLRLVNA